MHLLLSCAVNLSKESVPFWVAVSDRKSAISLSFHLSPPLCIHVTDRHFRFKRRGLVFLKIFDGNFDPAREWSHLDVKMVEGRCQHRPIGNNPGFSKSAQQRAPKTRCPDARLSKLPRMDPTFQPVHSHAIRAKTHGSRGWTTLTLSSAATWLQPIALKSRVKGLSKVQMSKNVRIELRDANSFDGWNKRYGTSKNINSESVVFRRNFCGQTGFTGGNGGSSRTDISIEDARRGGQSEMRDVARQPVSVRSQ
ncbi:hypothetical protein B0H14DRAFT_2607989 [Mycena olivaceomarginata]|nr:hypothetical protein B0H14DRAFT_2607989 [Mycena olivaceomarginata]